MDEDKQRVRLLRNIKKNLPRLEQLLDESSRLSEDFIYRFYHQSFKVYHLQGITEEMVVALEELLLGRKLNSWFLEIVKGGTGKKFTTADNFRWLKTTHSILEAFFHARYFLEMAVRYGKSLESPPDMMPSGWAALLYLYNLR
ncbi:MAG: hypothetical protein Q7S73_01095 [bacterium]|nr:hypothetical protein [bacterium]